MRKFSRRMTSGVLAAAMLIPTFSAPAAAETTELETYTIYPTPQSLVYKEGTTAVSSDVNVVYSSGIDEFTKDRAEEVFDLIGSTTTVSNAKAEGKTNVYVGIQGEESPAKAYFDEKNSIQTADLFSKTDAYALAIDGDCIVVLGATTDAAFYGLTSLKHIFNQTENSTVRNLLIEDFADVKTRGFIEGYYGNPWSVEDRADLMTFGGDYKLNGYFYAPKDDPKHNSHWRELYTEEELEKHRQLAIAGNESKCYYIYALHPFMHNAISFGSDYQSDLQIIKDKFEQMMNVGVKQFAILADDAGVPGNNPQNYVTLMNDLTDWLKEKQKTVEGLKSDMIFCPNDYMGNGSSSQLQTLKQLPDSVSIIETGGQVWGTVGPSFNNTFYNNMGRPAFMWINWPCSDNTKDSLIMGSALRFLAPGTNPDTVDGIVLNPMQQSEPSKQGIFTNADYAWNIWDSEEDYAPVWEDSFAFIDHGTIDETEGSNGLRELSKHMQYSRTPNTEESLDLKDELIAFQTKLANDTLSQEDIDSMREEFEILAKAAADYRANPGNQRMFDQIVYWIDAWDDTTGAVLNYLDTIEKLNADEPLTAIWDSFSKAQALRDQSETHTFHYVDHYESAKAGTKYVTPFMNRLDALLADEILPMVDPSLDRVRIITSRTDTPEGSIANATDNNPSTEIVYKTPSSVAPGDYFGVLRENPIDVDSVSILLGRAGNLNDTFPSAKLQYTQDGENWIDIGSETTSTTDMSQTGLGLTNVLGMRVYCTGTNPNIWLGVRDFVLNPTSSSSSGNEGSFSLPQGNGTYNNNTAEKAYDHDSSTFLWTDQGSSQNDTFTWTYDTEVYVRSVHIEMGHGTSADKWTSFVLETSLDGTNWTEHQTFTGTASGCDTFDVDLKNTAAKYVRIRNLVARENWVQLSEFTVDANAGDLYTKDNLITNTQIDAGVAFTSTSANLKAEGSITLQPGEYVGVDLERIVDIESIDPGTQAEGLIVESSRNNYEWQAFDAADPIGRYVRLINNTDAPVTFEMRGDLTVHNADHPVIELEESTMGKHATYGGQDTRTNGAAFDGDVNTSTLFADFPQQDQYIMYDLGQVRSISKLALYVQDSATNYITDAKVEISADKESWTEVFTIGDGTVNSEELDVNAVSSGIYKSSSTYPNKVYQDGTIDSTNARYIRISFPCANNTRFAGFNEIVINDGEFVPVRNAAFRSDAKQKEGFIPDNLFDGSLATAWTPDGDEAGCIEYDYSQDLDKNHFNIISKGQTTGATFSILGVKDGKKEWMDLGTIDSSLAQFEADVDKVLTVKISWKAGEAPMISEVIAYKAELSSEIVTTMLELALEKAATLTGFDQQTMDAVQAAKAQYEKALEQKVSQKAIDSAAKAMNRALLEVRKTPSREALEALN